MRKTRIKRVFQYLCYGPILLFFLLVAENPILLYLVAEDKEDRIYRYLENGIEKRAVGKTEQACKQR